MRLASILSPAPLVALSMIVAEPLYAQAPAQPRYLAEEDAADQQAAFLHFATQYSEAMVVGLLAGGLMMNRLVGGLGATLAGTVGGALIGAWLYIDQTAGTYVVREVR